MRVEMAGLPELLTVEEAARLIRVGRTKAYAMTREWRATDGRSGLPVVDFGNVLRVPRHALEELIGADLDDDVTAHTDIRSGRGDIGGPGEAGMAARSGGPTPAPERHASPAVRRSPKRSTRSRRASTRPSNQLDLFEPPTATPTA